MYISVHWASNLLLSMSGRLFPYPSLKTVRVFKTSVTTPLAIRQLRPALNSVLQNGDKWNFDLEDCDHILRVETHGVQPFVIIELLALAGYACAELGDDIPGGSLSLDADLDYSETLPAESLYTV